MRNRDVITVEVAKALQDWKDAQQYYDSVSDPQLVDYAVYKLEAAKKRYIYLLKRANNDLSSNILN